MFGYEICTEQLLYYFLGMNLNYFALKLFKNKNYA